MYEQNGQTRFIIKGNSLEERFKFLYDNGYFEKSDIYHAYRELLKDFHAHLCKKQTGKVNEIDVWKTIGVLISVDYRTLKDFTLHGKNPQKTTWDKLKPLLDLLKEKGKERKYEQ
jgi:hypothetical protein